MARLPALVLSAFLLFAAPIPLAGVPLAGAHPVAAAVAATWTNATFSGREEARLVALTNQARTSHGLRALSVDSTLTSLARWRSSDMATRGYFSHNIPPSGQMVFDRMRAMHIPFVLAGENIGWTDAAASDATGMIEQMFLASPAHRENIMGTAWDRIGVGAYRAASGRIFYTVLFEQTHPGLGASAAVPASVSAGGRVTFTASVSGGVAPYRYGWYANGAWLAGGRVISVDAVKPGTVTVGLVVVDAAGAVARVNRSLSIRP